MIGKTLGLIPVVPTNFSKAKPLDNPIPTLLYGVELEVENTHREEWEVPGMISVADGSLRDDGWEYISKPMTYSNLVYTLDRFFTKSKVTQEKNYSERCSIHLHTNCQNLTFDQLSSLLLLYQVFERVLFDFVGNDRDKNIFCVPWYETVISAQIVDKLKIQGIGVLKNWQKYTALNLLPLFTQGSVEFRHMPGNCDIEHIAEWLRIIGCLYAFVEKMDDHENLKQTILQLNTNSLYRGFSSLVFPEKYTSLINTLNPLKLEEGVIQTKYALLNEKDISKEKVGRLDGLFRERVNQLHANVRPALAPRAIGAFDRNEHWFFPEGRNELLRMPYNDGVDPEIIIEDNF